MDALIAFHKPPARPRPLSTGIYRAGMASRRPVRTTPEALVSPGARVVMVAPHPDDEVLALGGTLAQLARRGHEVLVYAVTDGEASHPHSACWTPEVLRHARPSETEDALARLGLKAGVIRLGLPDGAVAAAKASLAARLQLRSDDTVFVPWRFDGHPDHEACARAALAAARNVSARCVEFPVWALVPEHAAHRRLRDRTLQRVDVAADMLRAKVRSLAAFRSQVLPDGDTAAVLQPSALRAWSGRHEWVMG